MKNDLVWVLGATSLKGAPSGKFLGENLNGTLGTATDVGRVLLVDDEHLHRAHPFQEIRRTRFRSPLPAGECRRDAVRNGDRPAPRPNRSRSNAKPES